MASGIVRRRIRTTAATTTAATTTAATTTAATTTAATTTVESRKMAAILQIISNRAMQPWFTLYFFNI